MRDFFIYEIIMFLIFTIAIVIIFTNTNTNTTTQQNYIQNLEEKLNIYRESYEEFCLEDSLRQSDVYE